MTSRPFLTPRLNRRAALQAGAATTTGKLLFPGQMSARTSQPATPVPDASEITIDRVNQAVNALDGIVQDMQSRTGVPGVSLAVVHDDEVLITKGYGVASTETNDPVDTDTVFQLASISKQIASTVVASIVGDGDVTWDSRVVDPFPEFQMYDPWVTSQITIRDMFCHRSGLPEHAGDLVEDLGYDRDEVLHRLRYMPPETSFRSTYNYTNFGLTAGAVAASNSVGLTWEDACDERLYEPAGMTRTSSRFEDFIDADNRASGHVLIDEQWMPEYVRDPDAQSPAGGVSSTADDMAQWMRLQLGDGSLDGSQVIPSEPLLERQL